MLTKQNGIRAWLASKFFFCILLLPETAISQVIPDGTTATPDPGLCVSTCTVTGGTLDATGTNLFHSFDKFSVPNGGEVIFDHGPTISHIFTRVTGGEISTIDGVIRTDNTSNTNLFLINPSGIIFGANGSLDLGGSFVATTADAIQFGDQGSFSTLDTDINPVLLTVNPSAFLFTQTQINPIINQSIAPNGSASLGGLAVQNRNSLLFVGGDIVLDLPEATSTAESSLSASGGQIELGGLSSPGMISLNISDNDFSLSYAEDASLADVLIENFTLSVSGGFNTPIGSITINADSLSFLDSVINNTSFFSPENAGNIVLRADSSVRFEDVGITNLNLSTGAGGNLEISTNLLSLEKSTLLFSTLGAGDAGNIFLDAETIVLSTTRINNDTQAFFGPGGRAGNIDIKTDTLSLLDDGTDLTTFSQISAITTGPATDVNASGRINIEAQESITLTGASKITSETIGQRNASPINLRTTDLSIQDSAAILATTSADGAAGNILVENANSVSLSGDSSISTAVSETATGNGGTIDIETQLLTLSDGAQLISNTDGVGNAGTIFVRNAQEISLSDSLISTSSSALGNGGDINIEAERLTAENNSTVSAQSTGLGPAGDLTIEVSERLDIKDGAQFSVSGEGSGDSGTLNVIGDLVVLNNGQLLASVQEGADGNIILDIENALLLRGDSLISAEASNDADGGNVDISSPFIIALFPDGPNSDGNDIQASADAGDGGLITIQTNALFNLAENIAIDGNMTNDLDASSGTGINGEVIITNLEIDPIQGTNTLATDPGTPTITEGCQASGKGTSQFINSGRSGVAPSPYDFLSSAGIPDDIYPPGQTLAQQPAAVPPDTSSQAAAPLPEAITEAQGWHKNTQGNIVLAAETPTYHSFCQRTSAPGVS